ncbi:MAG: MFS transporter [Verrucomicrobia bacterium]|jgi:MFS family permease|nr:MFS transporter [Verrucomicrobiota bacterium]
MTNAPLPTARPIDGVEPGFPPGLPNAFRFAAFNALSFQMVLGSPMILYAKSLGASATVIGLVAGMMPLLVIFQIPAASHIGRIGYRRFVVAGWSTRVGFIFGMALLPWTEAFLDAQTRLALLLALLFCFNLSRGISSSAWLPWITSLVPPAIRGRYLARDAGVANLASFAAFVMAGGALAGETRPWQFSLIFAFSALTGAVSLTFLNRIPDMPAPDEPRRSTLNVPWLEMARYAPFRKLLRAVVAFSIAYGGLTAFSVSFLKVSIGMNEGTILFVTSVAFLGGVASLWFLGPRLDQMGSRPVLGLVCALWGVVLTGWMAIAGRLVPPHLTLLLALQFLMGLLAALTNMANNRHAMAVIPTMGRNHFFAIYSVVSNVTLGLAPIGWGLLMDVFGARAPLWLGLEWNPYTLFFAASLIAFAATGILVRRLDEPGAVGMDQLLRDVLIESPQRFWLRFWPRS